MVGITQKYKVALFHPQYLHRRFRFKHALASQRNKILVPQEKKPERKKKFIIENNGENIIISTGQIGHLYLGPGAKCALDHASAAYILIIFSGVWKSGGARLSSYLLQFHATVYLTFILATKKTTEPFASLAACCAVAALAYLHYRWARSNAPPADIRFFARYDRKDFSAALLLILALISGFYLLDGLTSFFFAGVDGRANLPLVTALQSIIINGAAAGLVIWGYLGRDQEKRNIAIFIIMIGGMKVFFHDLVAVAGLPLVGSVLSFGMATAVLSIVMSRWHKRLDTASEIPEQ